MAGDSDPGLLQAIGHHMPWIAGIGLFIAGLWSSLIGWLWRRQVQRGDDHGERIRKLEREKASNQRVDRIEDWLRDDVRELHDVQRAMNDKLDRLLGHRN